MADLIGQQFGNYRLTTLLGRGGYAEVYLGEHVKLGMQAAIKVLHGHLVGEAAEDFQAEARIISELRNAHIIRVLDFDIERGMPFLVLDYAPEGSLAQRHKRGTKVPLEQVVTYVEQVADALQYAHDRKLIHRDVKPANMLVGRQGEILLSDFGIAAVAHSTSSMHTESAVGTLAYMAPEQLQGHARAASDQYALAVTVYQWLSGELPFRGTPMEISGQQLGAIPTPLRSLVPTIAPAVEQVVLTALAKDPHARFQNVRAFASELSRASQEKGSQAASYTGTTVIKPHKAPPDPAFATQPAQDIYDPIVPKTLPAAQTPYPGYVNMTEKVPTAQTPYQGHVNINESTPSTPYLQPAVPYTPPAVRSRTRIGWTVFWWGLILMACIIASTSLLLALNFSILFVLSIAPFLCFAGGWGVAQKTGLLRSSFFMTLWSIFWLLCFIVVALMTNPSQGFPSVFYFYAVIGTIISLLGGLVGRYIYNRSNQQIHPPAGGSISR